MDKPINRRLHDAHLRKWREGKVRPSQGNPPHDRLVSRGIRSSRRICDDPFPATSIRQLQRTIPWRAVCVFLGIAESIGPMWSLKSKPNPGAEAVPPPDGRPRAQVKERAGRIAPSSSSAMSSDRLILDRVGRHQSRRVGPGIAPEPLTDPDLSLSTHPARATHRKLPPSVEISRFLLLPVDQIDPNAGDPPPSLHGRYSVSSVLRGSPPLTGALVLSASWSYHLRLFPYHRQSGSQVPYESPDEIHAA